MPVDWANAPLVKIREARMVERYCFIYIVFRFSFVITMPTVEFVELKICSVTHG